jgi:hypothetical protein
MRSRRCCAPDHRCSNPSRRRGPPRARCPLLAGEALDRRHDPVRGQAPTGARAQVRRQIGEVDGLPEAHVGTVPGGHLPALQEQVLRAREAQRDDRGARFEREPGRAGLALVQQAVPAAGALGVDAEALAGLEHVQGRVERSAPGAQRLAVQRDRAHRVHEPLLDAALEAAVLPEHVLGDEADHARGHHGDDEAVHVGQVVGGQQERTGARDVLEPGDPGAPVGLEHGRQDRLGDAVEERHGHHDSGAGAGLPHPVSAPSPRWPREAPDQRAVVEQRHVATAVHAGRERLAHGRARAPVIPLPAGPLHP